MSIAKKRANRNFNEIAASTTCAWKKSGLSHSMRRTRRLERKVGNRYEAALHWASFDDLDEPEATAVSTPPAAGEIYGSFYDLLDERGRPGALFGSALGAVHGTFIRFQVLPALRMHRLKSDSYHAESLTPLIEFDMSAAQFAELITTLNMGSGVPCTLRRLDGREIPRPPEDAQGEAGRVRSSYEADIKNLGKKVRAYAQQIMTLVKTLPAARKREVEIALECIEQQLGSNSTFALDRFVDATERVETASKAEVEAFLTHALTSAGLVALREQVPKLETESGGEARRLQGVVPCAGRCHGANAASSLPHACTYKNNVGTGCMCSCCEACTMACAQDP